jgi:putative flippase GtrA
MERITILSERKDTWLCLRRFLIVGMLGTLIDLALFAGLHTLAGLPTLTANTCSYGAGMLNSFVLNRRWTYSHRRHKSTSAEFIQFALVNMGALTLNSILVLMLAGPFNSLLSAYGSGDLLAKLFATGVTVSFNFLANNFWTFHKT